MTIPVPRLVTFENRQRDYSDVVAARTKAPKESHAHMATAFRAGETLQQIGDRYQISRERVRQIISRLGVTRNDGGNRKRADIRADARAERKDAAYMRSHGCTWEQFKEVRAIGQTMMRAGLSSERTPLGAFQCQRRNAGMRGIEWFLTFWGWWAIWAASGKWGQRGRGQGYVMGRRGDEGPYAEGNVYITTGCENSSTAPKKKKSGLPCGVYRCGSGKFAAGRMFAGKTRYLGRYETPGAAHAAYLSASLADDHHPRPLIRMPAGSATCLCGKPRQSPGRPCVECRRERSRRYKQHIREQAAA